MPADATDLAFANRTYPRAGMLLLVIAAATLVGFVVTRGESRLTMLAGLVLTGGLGYKALRDHGTRFTLTLTAEGIERDPGGALLPWSRIADVRIGMHEARVASHAGYFATVAFHTEGSDDVVTRLLASAPNLPRRLGVLRPRIAPDHWLIGAVFVGALTGPVWLSRNDNHLGWVAVAFVLVLAVAVRGTLWREVMIGADELSFRRGSEIMSLRWADILNVRFERRYVSRMGYHLQLVVDTTAGPTDVTVAGVRPVLLFTSIHWALSRARKKA